MIIQDVLFVDKIICNETELYYRTKNNIFFDSNEHTLIFSQGGVVRFDTYFNCLSVDVLSRYTAIEDIFLRLKLQGRFKIDVLLVRENGSIAEEILSSSVYGSAGCVDTVVVPVGQAHVKGKYSFVLEALEEQSVFWGGAYESDVAAINDVVIALDICTYHREDYLLRNLGLLNKHIIQNPDSPLYQKLYVYVIDNGRTVKDRIKVSNFVKLFEQGDYGASGGFARGLIEIGKDVKKLEITNVIIMDDDIVLDYRVLERTFRLLSILKPEYKDAFIGAGMISDVEKYKQTEFGGLWNQGRPQMLHPNVDLREIGNILTNEINEKVEYVGWWYACIPAKLTQGEALPMPFFMKRDDQEFSLRHRPTFILCNGICVWHAPYATKYGSYLEYYLIRNYLYVIAIHNTDYSTKAFEQYLWTLIKRKIALYRYLEIDLILDAVNTFLDGFDKFKEHLLSVDEEAFLESLISRGYRFKPLEELSVKFSGQQCMLTKKAGRDTVHSKKNLMWGLLKWANRTAVDSAFTLSPRECYRAKQVLHLDYTFTKGFVTQKSFLGIFFSLAKYIKTSLRILYRYKKCMRESNKRYQELTCLDFWSKYLKIDI